MNSSEEHQDEEGDFQEHEEEDEEQDNYQYIHTQQQPSNSLLNRFYQEDIE